MTISDEPQGCLTAILKLFGISLGRSTELPALPYALRDDFLSPAELSFCRVLQQVCDDRAVVCPKVNLADLFYVKRARENRGARNRIDRKHVDFVLCELATMKPMCGVELDDSSHSRQDRIERDRFVDDVFAAAGLSLVRVPATRSYSVGDLADLLQPHLSGVDRLTQKAETADGSPHCPKCDEKMVLRTASKGEAKGQQFWGCANYPKCREIVRV